MIPEQMTITELPGFRLIDGVTWPLSGKGEFGIRDADYERILAEFGSTDFLFEPWNWVDPEFRVFGIADDYRQHYIHRPHLSHDYSDGPPMLDLVKLGKFNNIVTDFTVDDGYFYDLDGNPVYRSFRMELLCNQGWDLTKVTHDLRKVFKAVNSTPRKFGEGKIRIGNMNLYEVPRYNRDFSGSRILGFNFYPADYNQFLDIYATDKGDGYFDIKNKILGFLSLRLPEMRA